MSAVSAVQQYNNMLFIIAFHFATHLRQWEIILCCLAINPNMCMDVHALRTKLQQTTSDCFCHLLNAEELFSSQCTLNLLNTYHKHVYT